jgi:hypothetical protein
MAVLDLHGMASVGPTPRADVVISAVGVQSLASREQHKRMSANKLVDRS